MKKTFPLIAFVFISINLFAQTPKNVSDQEFEKFLKYFFSQTFSEKNFDSLVYVSSPLLNEFIDKTNIGFGRFYNPGVSCNLFEYNNYGYNFYESYYGETFPNVSNLTYFSNKYPKSSSEEEEEELISKDGIYYNLISELPEDWDMDNGKSIPPPIKFKNLKKIEVIIQYNKQILKCLYFIKRNNKWYLLYIYDCDASA